MRFCLFVIAFVLVGSSASAQTPANLTPSLSQLNQRYESYELRWMMESYLRPKYLNGHHKKAVKAFTRGNWAEAVTEYEACVREFGLSLRATHSDSNLADVRQAQLKILNSLYLNTIRFELALSYASRAEEMANMGWSDEADSLMTLSAFFLEHVRVVATGPQSAGLAFIRLGDLNLKLGRREEAVRSYHGALWVMEDALPKTDPLRATAAIRLGMAYLSLGDYDNAESPLLRGTECADSAAFAHKKLHTWCYGLSVEGRLMLAEDCRQLGREQEAESLFAEAMDMAMGPEEPIIPLGSLGAFENYARMLRSKGDQAEADSVNYNTDSLRRRWEHDQASKKRGRE